MADGVTTRGAGDELLVEARGPIRIVTLNRPDALNAADEALHGEIARIWRELADDDGARAIVLTGAGKAFSAGGDINLLDRMVRDTELRDRIMAEGVEIVRAMTSVRVPIIAAVNGPAVGGALTWPLLTSLLRAKEFIILGDRLKAPEAVQLGLANRVVEKGASVEVALELAERVAALPPQAVVETKAVLNDALRRAVGTVLEGAITAETASFDEPAFQANLASFLNR
jgi:enoyl-CoA hydratase